jgi:hypothetical protein
MLVQGGLPEGFGAFLAGGGPLVAVAPAVGAAGAGAVAAAGGALVAAAPGAAAAGAGGVNGAAVAAANGDDGLAAAVSHKCFYHPKLILLCLT